MKTYRFTTVITQEGRWYNSRCVELDVVSQGKNIEESQKNLKEAVSLYLEGRPKTKIQRYIPKTKTAPLVTTFELNYA